MSESKLNLQGDVHRRLNPLTGEWVLVSPHRSVRPWQGQTEVSDVKPLAYDPECYLCPGNARAGGLFNPQYISTFVFDNDFAALLPSGPKDVYAMGDVLFARAESGRCRVICYSPQHNLTLAQLSQAQIRLVIDAWTTEYIALGADPRISAVTIFENRGAMMGASNPHPHGQIWANENVPQEQVRESLHQANYFQTHQACLLCEYLAVEERLRERIVCENGFFIGVVPFWATWPFETLVLPRRHAAALDELDSEGRDAFAEILKELGTRYDRLFDVSFPYTMGLHQRPVDGKAHPYWHLHAHFYPPLLRSASVRKFMVGYEMLAGPQRDITPELAARRLRG